MGEVDRAGVLMHELEEAQGWAFRLGLRNEPNISAGRPSMTDTKTGRG